ncbi:universal stress protein [candidate division KSB1 bacterium]|nr:MAG: universal stress protein [candidate division KSB1 bacterium]
MDLIKPVKKILIYVDGSEECITAAQYAIVLAKNFGAELYAMYVVNESILKELLKANIFIKAEEMDYEHDLVQDGKRYLHYISELAKEKGINTEIKLEKGVVNKVVTDYIKSLDIDLVVLGELEEFTSRSDSFHDETELILRKAQCSVLIVKDPDKVEQIYNSI